MLILLLLITNPPTPEQWSRWDSFHLDCIAEIVRSSNLNTLIGCRPCVTELMSDDRLSTQVIFCAALCLLNWLVMGSSIYFLLVRSALVDFDCSIWFTHALRTPWASWYLIQILLFNIENWYQHSDSQVLICHRFYLVQHWKLNWLHYILGPATTGSGGGSCAHMCGVRASWLQPAGWLAGWLVETEHPQEDIHFLVLHFCLTARFNVGYIATNGDASDRTVHGHIGTLWVKLRPGITQ